jgi:hypothetical protein
MQRPLRLAAFSTALLLALPAMASIWVTNRTATKYEIEIQCKDQKVSTRHLEANTAANYSLPKGAKSCQITLKDEETETPLARIDLEDGAHYDVNEGAKLSKR